MKYQFLYIYNILVLFITAYSISHYPIETELFMRDRLADQDYGNTLFARFPMKKRTLGASKKSKAWSESTSEIQPILHEEQQQEQEKNPIKERKTLSTKEIIELNWRKRGIDKQKSQNQLSKEKQQDPQKRPLLFPSRYRDSLRVNPSESESEPPSKQGLKTGGSSGTQSTSKEEIHLPMDDSKRGGNGDDLDKSGSSSLRQRKGSQKQATGSMAAPQKLSAGFGQGLLDQLNQNVQVLGFNKAAKSDTMRPSTPPSLSKEQPKKFGDCIGETCKKIGKAISANPSIVSSGIIGAGATTAVLGNAYNNHAVAVAGTAVGCVGVWCQHGIEWAKGWKAKDKAKKQKRDLDDTSDHYFARRSLGYGLDRVDTVLVARAAALGLAIRRRDAVGSWVLLER